MALVLRTLMSAYNTVFDDWSDPRVSKWPLMSSPFPTLAILAFYLYFVQNLGPKLMLYREPMKLKSIMVVYNIIQIGICTYLGVAAYVYAWAKYKIFCEPVDYSNSDEAVFTAKLVYIYYLIKLADLIDTVFFVFRKKESHVSFLHVYHHTGMVALSWSAVKFLPGGHGTSLGVINSFVHVVMYTYYLLSLLNDKYKKSIWWKKHITQLQIIQFFMITIHFVSLLFKSNCNYPRWVATVVIPQNLFMLILFLDFYVKVYMRKERSEKSPPATNGVEPKHQNGYKNSQGVEDKNKVN